MQVYREVSTIEVVAEQDGLSVQRLRAFVQKQLPDWEKTPAAAFIWHDPSDYECRTAISEHKLQCVTETLKVDLPTLLARAAAYWERRDADLKLAVDLAMRPRSPDGG
jgi:hypothetical protein